MMVALGPKGLLDHKEDADRQERLDVMDLLAHLDPQDLLARLARDWRMMLLLSLLCYNKVFVFFVITKI